MANSSWLKRLAARGLIVWMAAPFGWSVAAQAQQSASSGGVQSNPAQTTPGPASQGQTDHQPRPDSKPDEAYPDAPKAQNSPQVTAQNGTEPQSDSNSRPLGVAAAPYTKPTGVTGSRPAGAAIAPARQRRIRRILISVGAVVGAGIAIGTVAALSHSSPSRPPQ